MQGGRSGQGQGSKTQRTHLLESGEVEPHTAESYTLFPVQSQRVSPIQVKMRVNSVEMVMELDTGAALSVISERTYQKMWPHGAPDLEPSTVSLHTYTGEQLEVLGSVSVQVEYKDQHECLPLLVVQGSGSSLLGCNWLQKLRLDWPEIHQLQETGTLERMQ